MTDGTQARGRLQDKVVVITGAATGIGRAFATVFAAEGADVAIVDINEMESKVTQDLVRAAGREALVQLCDVSKPEPVDEMVRSVIDRFGRIDILVNGAILRQGGAMETLSLEQWDTLMNIGLRGYFIVGRRVGAEMIERHSGVIINIASTGGYHPYPEAGAYSPCKAAVIMLAKV